MKQSIENEEDGVLMRESYQSNQKKRKSRLISAKRLSSANEVPRSINKDL